MKIAVIDIATGAYAQFWENFYRASEQYFCIGGKISYEHFTDSEELQNSPLPNVSVHRIEGKGEFYRVPITIVPFSGGLGSQMFQYAFTIYIRSEWENERQWLADINKTNTEYQGYELAMVFNCSDIQPLSKNMRDTLKHFPPSYTHNVSEKKTSAKQQIDEPEIPIVTFNGNWQCYPYIKACETEIRKRFVFQESLLNNKSKETLHKIKHCNAVAVHIRRGNYYDKDNKYIYGGICNYDYYQRAIRKLEEQTEQPLSFFFFSDEPHWVKTHFRNENYHIIDWNETTNSWQDMCLMASCKHHIIANSSFSWWGAWLATWPGQYVIAPSAWYNTTDAPDLLPPHWQTIPVLPDKELLRELCDELLLNSGFLESPGLFNGKMGSVLFFFHYARYTQNTLYEEYAGELLERICRELAEETPTNFSNGLCGIGWGIEYLVHEGFLDCDTDEVLSDIDRKIMEHNPKRMTDLSFETGLEGIACYVQARQAADAGNDYIPFDSVYLTELETACIQNRIPFKSNNYTLHVVFERILSWSGRLFPEKLLKWQIGVQIVRRQKWTL